MAKNSTTSWTVVREYKNLCSVEEILRIVIRRHIEQVTQNIA